MAKAARFSVGSSGSGKHTETKGDGSQLGGRARAGESISVGPGVEGKRVTADFSRSQGGNGAPKVRGMSKYSEE